MITKEQKERILTCYRPWVYGYKRLARETGLNRDQVRQVVLTATKSMRRKKMTSSATNSINLNETKVVIEDRDLSQYGTDAERIEFLQDENRFLRALLIEYQKEFLPEALAHYPLFQSRAATSSESEPAEDKPAENNSRGKGASRSLKKKFKRRQEA